MYAYLNSYTPTSAFTHHISQGLVSPNQVVTMLNDQAKKNSPIEAARQALLNAKLRLEQHYDEKVEGALDGYLALRSRQTSYESELDVHQTQLEDFQLLSNRRAELSKQLSAAQADYAAYIASESTLNISMHNKFSLRVSSLENELESATQGIASLVAQANRYSNSQKQYASYLKRTGQEEYAAYEYQTSVGYTEENFLSETTDMIRRMEIGAKRWHERVSSYCEQYGLTPYDFERYLQERHKLSDAYLSALQRLDSLTTSVETASMEDNKQVSPPGGSTVPQKDNIDTVEISKRGQFWRFL